MQGGPRNRSSSADLGGGGRDGRVGVAAEVSDLVAHVLGGALAQQAEHGHELVVGQLLAAPELPPRAGTGREDLEEGLLGPVRVGREQQVEVVEVLQPVVGPQQAPDLDGYVTDKALDGLFAMIAAEEKRIRSNPSTSLTTRSRSAKSGPSPIS